MKIKKEYSNARELKSHLSSGSIVKSLLTINSRGRLAAGEGDRVTILDARQLIGQPAVAPSQANIPVTDLILTQSCFDIFTLARHCTLDEA